MSDWNNKNQPNGEENDFFSAFGEDETADDSSTDIQALFMKYLNDTDAAAGEPEAEETEAAEEPAKETSDDALLDFDLLADGVELPEAEDAPEETDEAAEETDDTDEDLFGEAFADEFPDETDDEPKKKGLFARLLGKMTADYGEEEKEEDSFVDYADRYADEYAAAAAGDGEATEEELPEEEPAEEEVLIEEEIPEEADETAPFEEETSEEEPAVEEFPEETDEYAAFEEEIPEEEPAADEFAEETSAEEETPDDTDINLMVAFGMDEELDRQVGTKKAERIREKMADSGNVIVREPVDYEYTSPSQKRDIADAYKSSMMMTNIKLAAACVAFVLLLIFENIAMFGVQFGGAFDPSVYPVSYIMIGLCGGLIATALAFEQIIRGFKALMAGRPSVETLLGIFAVGNVVYSIVLAITAEGSGREPQLFNAVLALCAVLALLFERISAKREILSFNVVASGKTKYVLRRILAANAPDETEAFETSSDVLKLEKTSFVDGFFSRSFTKDTSSSSTIAFLSVMIPLSSVLAAVIAGFMGDADPVRVAGMTFSAALPLSLLLSYGLPFYRACRNSYVEDATIVGECSLSEYADATLISIDEGTAYPSSFVKVKNVRVFNNYRFDKVLYFAGSVFRKTGGPLGDVFSVAAGDVGCSDDVELEKVGDGYITASVDGRRVTFGSAEALLGLGFPDVFPEDTASEENGTRVMYMFRDDILVAELYVNYVMDPDFEAALADLSEAGLSICVCSLDPNIDDDLLALSLDLNQYPIRVVKTQKPVVVTTLDRVDSGIVSRGTPKGLLRALSYCDDVLHLRRTGEQLSWASVLVTLILSIVLTVLGVACGINSFHVTLYQLLWMLPAVIMAYVRIKL
ncbi:MAG: hypothetical protein MJ088_02545 [Clostridia bacterium]|nr:hypothetical protein [Clostridia bacterium]